MISPNLILGAAVGRPDVQALAGKTSALLIDPEGYSNKPASVRERVREDRSSDIHFDRAVMKIQPWDECERVHIRPPVWLSLADLDRITAAVMNR